jgi:ribonuclease-3
MPALEDLQTALGYRFRDAALLSLSLTHPSVVHEEGGEQNHNQRLEFLGDAVIQLAITSELYQRFPGLGEGALTQARAQLVNRTSLAAQARRLQLGQHNLGTILSD